MIDDPERKYDIEEIFRGIDQMKLRNPHRCWGVNHYIVIPMREEDTGIQHAYGFRPLRAPPFVKPAEAVTVLGVTAYIVDNVRHWNAMNQNVEILKPPDGWQRYRDYVSAAHDWAVSSLHGYAVEDVPDFADYESPDAWGSNGLRTHLDFQTSFLVAGSYMQATYLLASQEFGIDIVVGMSRLQTTDLQPLWVPVSTGKGETADAYVKVCVRTAGEKRTRVFSKALWG